MDENNETTTEVVIADKKTVIRNRVLIAVGTAIGIFAAAALLKLITSTEDTIEVDGDATIVIEPSE